MKASGLTFMEIMVTLTILSFLVISFNTSGFSQTREKLAIEGVMSKIVTAIAFARRAAVTENKMVTFCRSDDGTHCQGKWHEGSIIFTDNNADRIINEDDRLLYRLNPVSEPGKLSFNSFGNRQYLQMTPRGMTNYQNGNFTFCPESGNPVLARQIVINFTGRIRHAKDTNGDGIVENSRGEPLTCD